MAVVEEKRETFRSYLRFAKVRHYLDVIYFAQKRQSKDVKKIAGVNLREAKFLLQVKVCPACSLVSVQKQQFLPSSTAAWLADNLVQKGYLSRRQNPTNRREVILDLSQAGEELLDLVDKNFFSDGVEDRLGAASDRDVAKIEESLKMLCYLHGVNVRD